MCIPHLYLDPAHESREQPLPTAFGFRLLLASACGRIISPIVFQPPSVCVVSGDFCHDPVRPAFPGMLMQSAGEINNK